MLKRLLLAACVSVLVLVAPSRAGQAADAAEWETLLARSGKTLAEAVEAAAKACGEGIPFHVELELDEGRVQFSVDLAQGESTCNAILDAKDARLIEKEVEPESHAALVQASKVGLAAAITTALAKRPGKAVEAKLSRKTGAPVITVTIVADGAVVAIPIDAVTGAVLAAPPAPAAPVPAPAENPFTDSFPVEATEWSSTGTNPWFSLEPGTVLVLEGREDGEAVRLTITVLPETKTLDGVETRVVEEREEADGAPKEISRNYFAMSKRTNCIYYFGEDVDEYEDGKVSGHPGSWHAGEKGARYGLMMPGTPLLGSRYMQEVAPEVALDRAEIVSLAATLETPAGAFTGCLKTEETTALEPGSKEYKLYARGVGLIRDGHLTLTKRIAPK